MKFHLITMVAVLAVAAYATNGCGSRPSETGGRKIVRFAGWGNSYEVNLFHEIVADFEAVNPDIKVELIHVPANYNAVLLTMIAGGAAPDMFYISPSSLTDLISKDILMNIEDRVAMSNIIDLSDYFPQTVSPYRYDGEQFGQGPLYGICKDWSPDYLVFYNKDLFDKAGIPYPDGSWTREEFIDIAQKLTIRDTDGHAVQYGVYDNVDFRQRVMQSGGRVYSEDKTRCLLNEPEALRALRYTASLLKEHRVTPPPFGNMPTAAQSMFMAGRVAMTFYGMWMTPQFRDGIKNFRWGVSTPPRDEVEVHLSGGMIAYGIYSKPDHPEATWKFFEFIAGPEGQQRLAKIGFNIPASMEAAYGPAFKDNPALDSQTVETFLEAAQNTRLYELNPYINDAEFNMYFAPQWELAMLGRKPLKEAMDTLVAQVNQAIDDNMAIMGKTPPGVDGAR